MPAGKLPFECKHSVVADLHSVSDGEEKRGGTPLSVTVTDCVSFGKKSDDERGWSAMRTPGARRGQGGMTIKEIEAAAHLTMPA